MGLTEQTDGRTDGPLHRPYTANYAHSVNNKLPQGGRIATCCPLCVTLMLV